MHRSGDLPVTWRYFLWFPLISGDTLDYFFCRKKKVLDWGDLYRGQGKKRDEKGQFFFFSIFFTARAVCAVN
jgi:hypothetical protein